MKIGKIGKIGKKQKTINIIYDITKTKTYKKIAFSINIFNTAQIYEVKDVSFLFFVNFCK